MALTTAIGIGAALLVAALLAVTAGSRGSDKSAIRANGGPLTIFTAGVAYLIVLAPRFTIGGVTLVVLILLTIVVVIPPVVSGLTAGFRAKLGGRAAALYDIAGVVLSFTLLIGVLASAGALLSLGGGVNRYLATAAIGISCAAYLLACGREGASRTSRWLLGIGLVIPVLLLAVGAVLGSPSTLTSSLVPSASLPLGAAAAVLLAVIAAGFVDPVAGLTLRGSEAPGKAMGTGVIILAGYLLIFGVALILVFGGAYVAPSLQAYLLSAAPAAIIAVFMFFAAYFFAATSDSELAAAAEITAEMTVPAYRRAITIVLAIVAVLIACFIPAPEQIFAIGATFAAATVGALVPAITGKAAGLNPLPGVIVGIAAAFIVALIMGFSSALNFNGATAIALIAAAVLSAVVSLALAKKAPAPLPATSPPSTVYP